MSEADEQSFLLSDRYLDEKVSRFRSAVAALLPAAKPAGPEAVRLPIRTLRRRRSIWPNSASATSDCRCAWFCKWMSAGCRN